MEKSQLAPGLRFHPTDVELVRYYLKRKVLGQKLLFQGISVVDIYKYAPWDLPSKSGLKSGDRKWYFFCPREKKYASGSRLKRSTDFGHWKTTGKDRTITSGNEVVGAIKTLIFYRRKAHNTERTDWVMHEYSLVDKKLAEKGVDLNSFVLCAVFEKDGRGPRVGVQYGAPFREEDWNDDFEESINIPQVSEPNGDGNQRSEAANETIDCINSGEQDWNCDGFDVFSDLGNLEELGSPSSFLDLLDLDIDRFL